MSPDCGDSGHCGSSEDRVRSTGGRGAGGGDTREVAEVGGGLGDTRGEGADVGLRFPSR